MEGREVTTMTEAFEKFMEKLKKTYLDEKDSCVKEEKWKKIDMKLEKE